MNKITLLLCAVVMAGCSTPGPRIPIVCLRNLRDCTAAYQDHQPDFCDNRSNVSCEKRDWDTLCETDMIVCQQNNGLK